jgi:hypothetical protein
MSTPQENPASGPNDGQAWTPPGAARNSPPADGHRNSGQAPDDRPGPDGYRGMQYSGYAYPGGGSAPQPAEKGPAPKEVLRASSLIMAAGALSLVASIISALTTEVPDVAGASLGLGVGIGVSVLVTAVYIVLAVFIRKGHNWARITATVLAALNVLSVLGSFLLMPLVARASGLSDQQLGTPSGLSVALSVIVMLLGVAGVVLTYLKPSRPYFAPRLLGH